MGELFGINLSGLIAEHVAPGLHPATLIVNTIGDRASGKLSEGRQVTPTTYTGARGIWEDVAPNLVDDSKIFVTDRVALLIGDTQPMIASLKTNDKISIEGIELFVIRLLKRDPAAATYQYLCRDRRAPSAPAAP